MRRLRDRRVKDQQDEPYKLPLNGAEILDLVSSHGLPEFTDAYVDRIVQRAASDDDDLIRLLAGSILRRKPPKMLKEVAVVRERKSPHEHNRGTTFFSNSRRLLPQLCQDFDLPLRVADLHDLLVLVAFDHLPDTGKIQSP